jgi:phosphoserine phosphatase
VRDLNARYRETPALWARDADPAGFEWLVADDAAANVLAFARRRMEVDHARLEHSHVAAGLTFLGLQGMMDPPRPEAIAAVHRCQQAGIAVKMITGDHLATARAIARQIGLTGVDSDPPAALSGRDLEKISDAQLPELAARTAVFARMAPEQKLRLVRALQSRGDIVAMTGDGVNDAPALKQADIGVAMGISGTDVAKGAADMILTDDNFASIEAAVEEGRGVEKRRAVARPPRTLWVTAPVRSEYPYHSLSVTKCAYVHSATCANFSRKWSSRVASHAFAKATMASA